MSIAIIGAGIVGSLAALDLASKGIPVDLLDRRETPVSEASFFNEGKIHLGFLYAKDPSFATSNRMIQGSAYFRAAIDRLVGCDVSTMLSTPFLYGIHRTSMVGAREFHQHLSDCCSAFEVEVRRTGGRYVDGSAAQGFRRLEKREWSGSFDEATFSDLFETSERAVDPRVLAEAIRRAVHDCDRITFHGGQRIEWIERRTGGCFTLRTGDEACAGAASYDFVVNATWSDLLRLDAGLGIEPPADWSYRYKLGNRIALPVDPDDLSSITVALGAFGDLVNFGPRGGIFLSWYPHGRMHMTSELALPDWNADAFASERHSAFAASKAAWLRMSPSLRRLKLDDGLVDDRGGIILASGRTDVDDPESPLHRRINIGIQQAGNYLSVNTGKFTLGPLMADEVSGRVLAMLA